MLIEFGQEILTAHGAGDGMPTPVAEERTKPFASTHKVATRVGEHRQVISDRSQLRRALVEKLIESSVD
jgi:hypothetical protein